MKHRIKSQKRDKKYIHSSVVVAAVLLGSTQVNAQEEKTVLKPVKLERSTNLTQSREEDYYVRESSSKKLAEALVDTPQTISVISKKVMQEQQATTLQEALRNTPGVTLLMGENGNSNQKNNISMRGFDVSTSIFKDGVREITGATRDMFNTEAIEVTKGTVGADNGRAVASGYINQVSKRAKNRDEYEASAAYFTGASGRVTADLNQKLSETSGIRVNLLKHKGDVPGRDEVSIDRTGIAASLAFGIGTDTRTTFNYEKYTQDDVPDGGIPTLGLKTFYDATLATAGVNAAKVDRENFYGSSNDFEKVETDTYTAIFEHDFSGETTLANTTRYGESKHEMFLVAPFSLITTTSGANSNPAFDVNNPATWTVRPSAQSRFQENEILTNQTNIMSVVEDPIMLHKITGGFDVTVENQLTTTMGTTGTLLNQPNAYNPDPNVVISNFTLAPTGAQSFGEIVTAGAYLFDSASIGDSFILSGGVRLDKYSMQTRSTTVDSDNANTIPNGTLLSTNLEDSGVLKSFKLGGLYKPSENGSVYLSYATSELPPGGANFSLSASASSAANAAFEPQASETLELGVKWEYFNNRLALTSAIYQTTVTNEVMVESDATVSQNGEREVKGIELGLIGEITPKWNITSGVGHNKTKVLNATNTGTNTQEGAALRFMPELTATLWSTYKVTSEFVVGVGAKYMGEMFAATQAAQQSGANRPPIQEVEDYVVVDAMASYSVTKDALVQLNIYNLTDKEYVANMNNSGRRYTPGSPLSGALSLNYKF